MGKDLHIPDDIVHDILRKLPRKSLFRFKCVCKGWQIFINRHHHQKLILSSPSSFQSANLEASKIKAVALEFPIQSQNGFMAIAACNGLLCVEIINEEGLVLWNPSTGSHKRIQVQPSNKQPGFGLGPAVFGFGPAGFGFGYNHSMNDYIIVNFLYDERSYRSGYLVEIYSLKTDSWEQKERLSDIIINDRSQLGVFVDGVLYWKILYSIKVDPCSSFSADAILCFDIVDEKFDVIRTPKKIANYYTYDVGNHYYQYDLGDFGGRFCLVQRHQGYIQLWTLQGGKAKGHENWIKFIKIPDLDRYLVPVCSMSNGDILLNVRKKSHTMDYQDQGRYTTLYGVGCRDKKFLSYTPGKNMFKDLKIQGIRHFDREIAYTGNQDSTWTDPLQETGT